MDLMLGFLLAMSITMVLIPPLMSAAARLQVLDAPGVRKVHSTPVPRVGGIAMAAGTLIAVVLSRDFVQPMPAYLAGVLVLLVFGVWDDRVTLGPLTKLLGQAIAVVLVMSWGEVSIGTITLAERHVLPQWLAAPLTFVFLLGVTNAVNLADGLDGLAGGTTLLALSAMALLAFTSSTPFVGAVAVIIIGAILGFLRYNTHPARVFMGDSGSQILGFSAGVLAVVLTQSEATALSSALPLALLGIPIIDTVMVMAQRLAQRRSPFQADRNHIHHRLLSLGFDHHEAVVVIYLLQGALFIAAWFLRYESDLTILATFAFVAIAAITTLHAAAQSGWRWRASSPASAHAVSPLGRFVRWVKAPERAPQWALMAIALVITIYFLAVARVCPAPSMDVRVMAGLLAATLGGTLIMRWRAAEASWLDKGALYMAMVMAVYFDRQTTTLLEAHSALQVALFATLVVAIGLRFRLASDRRFRITTLDVLVIFTALVIPNLPGSITSSATLGESVAKLIALMYAVETLLGAAGRWWRLPGLAALAFLGACILRV
ncbi:MAG TPA: MraY family glycosyltransferase [Steroidobacteraceae bacterium]|nr:MraY family glycosyltransferase [Steroidobacteraceae bacterium]